ncbi:hypothetical protein CE91St41_05960 [Oscillospiraceae bacterium]|nr:hypothetical protein CE91St40_05960 [Oscillospiraceae bacterium]BDF73707.1 hypothetical protein CE91St41_05960 [Oscillospiraceae bacterium]
MRNLKRALSLALAAVMVIGMMVVGAGAVSINDFSDADEIVNKDAVSMVTALGIINGLPGGSYGPTQNIDRASFVKMIALTLNGGSEPMLPGDNKVSYVDTKGTWAQQYIEFCTNLGIVAGDGTTGKFNPTSPVTISQAAKMLLVALGYNASIEGYIGYDWQMNVDSAANLAGLYNGISGNTSANATRDQAAQMIYNALSAQMVKYTSSWEVNTSGTVTAKPQVSNDTDSGTLLEAKFGAIKVTGVVQANEYAGLDKARTDAGKTYIHITEQPRRNNVNDEVKDGVFGVSSTADMLGKSVTMFVKVSGGSTTAKSATVLGSLILTTDNTIVELSSGKDSRTKIDSFLKDENLKMDSKTGYYINFVEQTGLPSSNNKGEVTTFIDYDNDGVVDYALQSIKTFGKVDGYTESGKGSIYVSSINPSDNIKTLSTDSKGNVTLTSISSSDAVKDVKGFEDVAKGDYVFFYNVGGDTAYVEKAEYVDVTVTSIKGDKVTAGGTTYEASGLINKFGESNDQTLGAMVSLGDEVRLYLDASGYVTYTDSVNTSSDYALVVNSAKYDNFSDTIKTKLVLSDGTSITAEVKHDADLLYKTGDDAGRIVKGVYTYSVNSKTGVYTLTALPTGTKGYTQYTDLSKITKGNAKIANAGNDGILANGSTIFVVSRGSSYSVYTGIANVPSMDVTTATAAVKGGVAKVVFVTDSSVSGTPEGVYVLSTSPTISGTKDDPTYTYDVIYKGEKTTLTGENKSMFTDTGYYGNVEINGTEIAKVNLTFKDGSTAVFQPAPATANTGNLIATTQQGTYVTTDKTVVLIADGTDVTVASLGAVIIDNNDAKNTSNIVIVPSTDNDGIAATVIICK